MNRVQRWWDTAPAWQQIAVAPLGLIGGLVYLTFVCFVIIPCQMGAELIDSIGEDKCGGW